MIRIEILNPNATASMTEDMVAVARSVAPPGCHIVGRTNVDGPAAIQSEDDGEECLPGLFTLAGRAITAGADAIIIGCFDDTGLVHLRDQSACPVVGLGEAAFLVASLSAPRFAVLTTTDGSVPVIRRNIDALSLGSRCGEVRAAQIPVLELEQRLPDLRLALAGLHQDTDAGAMVLGCAGMSTLTAQLSSPSLPPLVDPVRAAIILAHAALVAAVKHPRPESAPA